MPESGMFRVGSEASLAKATFPFTVPADCGAKTTLKVVLCPGVKVKGTVSPFKLNPAPVTVACETVAFEPPELLSVTV